MPKTSGALVLTVFLLACSEQSGEQDVSPWTEASVVFEVKTLSPFAGAEGFRQTREALTEEQLQLLSELRVIPEGTLDRSDPVRYDVAITSRDGTVSRYRSISSNNQDVTSGEPATYIDFLRLAPFFRTYECLNSFLSHFGRQTDAGVPETYSLSTNPGCLNGVWAQAACSETLLQVNIPDAKSYTFSAEDCKENMSFELSDASGTQLATSPADMSCPTLTYAFSAPGSYQLKVVKKNAAGCTRTRGDEGPYFVRVSKAD